MRTRPAGRREFIRELTDTPEDLASRDRVEIRVSSPITQLARLGCSALPSPASPASNAKGTAPMPVDTPSGDARPEFCPDPDSLRRVVLEKVVDLHPVQLTLTELVRELTDTPDDFASRDRIEIAVQQLNRAGLLHRNGAFVLPTRALIRAIELGVG